MIRVEDLERKTKIGKEVSVECSHSPLLLNVYVEGTVKEIKPVFCAEIKFLLRISMLRFSNDTIPLAEIDIELWRSR